MKTFKHLYPMICSFENLELAARKARRHKRYRTDALAFDRKLEENLWQLHDELSRKTYRPGACIQFMIHEPKERLITAAPYRDRVVHHAVCNAIEPIFEARFIHDSYACRVNRGTHKAVDRCQELLQRYPYVLQGDVQRFFPSVDHGILMRIFRRRFRDVDLLWLLDLIIQHHETENVPLVYFPRDDLFTPLERHKGIPIGNLTSQLFANIILNELDQFTKHGLRVRAYLRYMDDFLLFGDDKQQLANHRQAIRDYLADMRLSLHPRKSEILTTKNGVPFLGFHVYPDHRRVLKSNVRAFQKRLARWQEDYRVGRIELEEIRVRIRGWIGHVSHADSWRLRSAILMHSSFSKGQSANRLQPC